MKVKVVAGNRGRFVLRWTDAEGKVRQRTLDLDARKSNRSKAYQLAAQLESELSGDAEPDLLVPKQKRAKELGPKLSSESAVTGEWSAYRAYFIETHLDSLSASYRGSMLPILNRFEKFAQLENVSQVKASIVRRWLASLRDENLAPTSIKTYWRHLSAFLSIAVADGLLSVSYTHLTLPTKRIV